VYFSAIEQSRKAASLERTQIRSADAGRRSSDGGIDSEETEGPEAGRRNQEGGPREETGRVHEGRKGQEKGMIGPKTPAGA
jgi:hypothetical protein